MIIARIAVNGTTKLILQGETPLEIEALKSLHGGTAEVFTEPLRFVDEQVPEGLMIQVKPPVKVRD